MLPRFFVPPEDILKDTAYIRGDDAKHISVLRIGAEERFVVCDGLGTDHICVLESQEAGLVTARILESAPSVGEPGCFCTVYAGFPKGDKAENIVQKAVELGAGAVCFFPSARCVSRPDDKSLKKKLERLNRVALEAAKQCGRGRVPRVSAAGSFKEAVKAAAGAEMPLFLWEDEHTLGIRAALTEKAFSTAAVMTGPEGGFAPEEADFARAAGMHCVTVGPRILRCETAPIAALAALMYESGNF